MKRNSEVALVLSTVTMLFVVAMSTISTVKYWPSGASAFPASSSELASWIQAVGSIGALLGAFFLGAHQADNARKLAMQLEQERWAKKDASYKAVVQNLITVTHDALTSIQEEEDSGTFKAGWSLYTQHEIRAALNAFDGMPLHDLGSQPRIFHACGIRNLAQRLLADVHQSFKPENLADLQYEVVRQADAPGHREALEYLEGKFLETWDAPKANT